MRQPDRDPVLDQAARFDRALLPYDVVNALKQRALMRSGRVQSHEAKQHGLWRSRSRSVGYELD
ncbi:MAG: hypothetical protein JOZ49_15855 [Mycolicibacterium sp.]|nr:hypothetical protein [Mycolicibacterium sp.]